MQCKKWIHIGAWLMSSLGSLDPVFLGSTAARLEAVRTDKINLRRLVGMGQQQGSLSFAALARKRVKHVWALWGCFLVQLRLALVAQRGLGRRQRGPNPVRAPA